MQKQESTPQQHINPAVPLFGDPKEYEKMSTTERDKLTNDMLSKHKTWVNNGLKT